MTTQTYLSSALKIGESISKGVLNLIDAISKPKLKIALISYYYQKPTKAGVAIHVQNLAKHLVKK